MENTMLKKMRPLLLIIVIVATLLGMMGSQPQPVSADGGSACAKTHVVAHGQNLFRIGLMYGVRWDILQAWNGLPNSNLIYVGQVLCVSGPAGSPATPPPPGSPGTVYPGNPFGPTTQPRIFFPQITLGQTFQLSGYNFPRNSQITISMAMLGYYNPYTAYYTANTDASGSFIVAVTIPDTLKVSPTVAVQATAPGGYWAKNWFYNR
jgi:hypothetical protein